MARTPPPSEAPVIVCLGDSITLGTLGADWVAGLAKRLGDAARVVNAGMGGQVTWDLRQRLDDVARHEPAAIVLLAGSNDAVGALGGSWASFYERGRPEAPSERWFAEQYDAVVTELLAIAPRVACLTLPPLGEDPTTEAAGIVRRQNEVIGLVAEDRGADVLEVHATLNALRTDASPGVPFLSGLGAFMTWTLGSVLRRRVLGQSWDRIARDRGLVLTADTIHPTEHAGDAMLDLIEPWARRALGRESQPGLASPDNH